MCKVTLNIDEAQVRRINPSLTDMDAITRWAQRIIDNVIATPSISHRNNEALKPYTIEELHARIDKAECDSAEGRYRTHDEVFAKYHKEILEAV